MPSEPSNAKIIKELFRRRLSDGQPHSVADLEQYARQGTERGGRLTPGMLSGALKSLVDSSNGTYVRVERGVYQLAGAGPCSPVEPHVQLAKDLCALLERTDAQVKTLCRAVIDPFIEDEADAEIMAAIRRLLSEMERCRAALARVGRGT